ncbi:MULTISPECIES: TIGR02117 family protein [unclassified Neisseria]|uniref:TIGR02117 family protein n=1 Tax=unclassified Neisseria TaxID=2623750 RepID=UPI002666C253|nr:MULTISPECIES: TIGR02117 family protein [unclassified Neisseria]MDO1509847.1 TIGR02117 family protein [Neisseria sp. MVDL19-042950]MDO1516044.1 TIGR02117 family protein [Neisseria sp. MVDL18-041461]MDO1563160.1 TIGR02117 family protein [Neisseria sp. MVDL20-010259]
MPRKIFSFLLKGFAALTALIALYFFCAWLLGRMEINTARKDDGTITLYLLSNGVHTDIAMPLYHEVFDWTTVVHPSHARQAGSVGYVGLGWGDREFYLDTPTWKDLKVSTALKAATGLGRTAIHATFYPLLEENENSIRIQVSPEEYRKLVHSILPAFKRQNNHAVPVSSRYGYGDYDVFYEANGRYSLLTTCNTWTNRHLKNSGVKAVVWTPFAGSLMNAYRNRQEL